MSFPDPQPQAARFAQALLHWFGEHRRDFPWRRTRDPYRIWVSEIMLQQTRTDTVVPYYERFLERFPDVAALAAAPMDDVLKAWEGLGYYRRARNLKAAAEELVARGLSTLPDDFDAVLALPGVGRYTAGAVMSLAFNRAHPIVDGNVKRVLCRVWAVDDPPAKAPAQRWLWSTAEVLIPAGSAGQFNEGLMELGATVCTPRDPSCVACPLAQMCVAGRAGNPLDYPRKAPRKPIPHLHVSAGIIRRGRKILISRRREGDMLGGLWEFPGGKQEPGESMEECLRRELREELDITVRIERPFVKVKHAYSHFRITLHTFLCRHSKGKPRTLECDEVRWVLLEELDQFAFPKADRVVLEALKEL